jgi:aminopeptidase N
MKKYLSAVIFLSAFLFNNCTAQLMDGQNTFTRVDSLRGMLTPLRTCYDVTYYHLSVEVDTNNKSIKGTNVINFTSTAGFQKMQIDLFENMKIEKILFENKPLTFTREFGAVYVSFPKTIVANTQSSITVYYSGKPQVGKLLPWDGGFTWTADDKGNTWIAVACQGTGASLWWPCKEHQSDEPDSMLISVTVPKGLMDVSNGRLLNVIDTAKTTDTYNWFVSYPINNYNVTLNIGKFVKFSDVYESESRKTLPLDYYVMPYNLEKAQKHFEQVKPMLQCYEKYFGEYPFYRDGYKLIETPYLGMEHQSAIAYGNQYKTGYFGSDFSGIGQTWDYIIIHETAHEWWGNSITTKDIADMWVHEGFGAYSEAIYVECMYNNATAIRYLNAQKKKVDNKSPVIGNYNVNSEGSGDMYPKGSLMLHTIRNIINDDDVWFSIIKGLQKDFAYQTITSKDVEDYIAKKSGKDLSKVFNQYLRHKNIPVFEYKVTSELPFTIQYRWKADVAGFDMPIKATTGVGVREFIYPTADWQTLEMANLSKKNFKVAEDLFFVKMEELK